MDGQTQIKLTLAIGRGDPEQSGQLEFIDLQELVPNWAELDKDELEEALHKAWVEWAWNFIDGCAEIVDKKEGI